MARHYSTQEALDIIMHSDCEDGPSSSSVDSEADTEEALESTEDASEVGTDNSDSSETESGGELEEAAAGWTYKNASGVRNRDGAFSEPRCPRFHQISRELRFNDQLSRPRRRDDKLAAFRKVWDMWTHRLPMLFIPFSDVC
ncbi:hypothetical protein KUCAC02_007519, partial [Chaenocephalus aceratus]